MVARRHQRRFLHERRFLIEYERFADSTHRPMHAARESLGNQPGRAVKPAAYLQRHKVLLTGP